MPATTIDILLVEDNPGDVRLAQETLNDYRIQNTLHVVGDGEEALKYLRKQAPYTDVRQPDMVLLDLNLPKIDGIEVLTEMQDDPALRHIAVVVLTAAVHPPVVNFLVPDGIRIEARSTARSRLTR